MIGWWAWVWASHASPGFLDTVRPVAAPWDVMQQYAEWSEANGAARQIHCDAVWTDHVRLCFRKWEGQTRRWLELDDLEREGLTTAALRERIVRRGEPVLGSLEQVGVDGMAHQYWQIRDGDGWGVWGALKPAALARAMGSKGGIHVAIPSQGVLLAWPVGSPELDHVMAVGVREMYDQQADPVSAVVHTWDGSAWTILGEAKPAELVAPASPSPG